MTPLNPPREGKERILILGSGWAGYILSRRLKTKPYSTTLISPRSYFVFTPLLNDTTVGTLEFPHVVEPVRDSRTAVNFVQGWARSVDFKRKVVSVEGSVVNEGVTQALAVDGTNGSGDKGPDGVKKRREKEAAKREECKIVEVSYDKLVIAVGCNSKTFGTPGVKENALFLKDVGDARKIRRRVLECFELAAHPTTSPEMRRWLLHFAVVGGGPTGMEFAAVVTDFMKEDLMKVYPKLKGQARVTVYDVAPRVLSMFDESLVKYASQTMKREGIEIKTQHHVLELRWGAPGQENATGERDPNGCLTLKTEEEGEVGVGMCVWSTGNATNQFVRQAMGAVEDFPRESARLSKEGEEENEKIDALEWTVKKDKKTGALLVDDHMRVQLSTVDGKATAILTDVFALGDNCTLESGPLPATAQTANQEALWLAKRLNKGDLEQHEGFSFKNMGVITYLGGAKGLIQAPGKSKGSGLVSEGIKGRTAWLVWKGAYLTMSVSWRNRILIVVYWFVNWAFGKDISRF